MHQQVRARLHRHAIRSNNTIVKDRQSQIPLIRQKPRLFTLLFRAIELNAMGLKKHRIGSPLTLIRLP